jgi:predicted aldo/keto reductase-like oxidoreductase
MEYRLLGRTGLRVGLIGFGSGYLYRKEGDEIANLVSAAIAHGVNYFDSWIPNPEARKAIGRAVAGRRSQVHVAGHLGVFMNGDQSDVTRDPAVAERHFEDMLRQLGTDYIDVLMLHNVDKDDDYEQVMDGGLLDCAKRLVTSGKARFVGLSGHEAGTTIRAAKSGNVDVVMAPVGIAWHPPGITEACAANGVGLVAMKPFWGGELLQPPYSATVTPVIALSYVLDQPAVATAVPGFGSVAELEASLAYLTASPAERDYQAAVAAHGTNTRGTCIYCGHCQPCSAGIDIGDVLSVLRSGQRGSPYAADRYRALKVGPSMCTACGECLARCPQEVPIIEQMQQAVRWFGG